MSDTKQTAIELALTCVRCGVLMKVRSVTLSYLGHKFTAQVPQCEECGQVYLSEELVRGKIAEVEELLEDK